jgi:RND family efflux transporter MFP subunit
VDFTSNAVNNQSGTIELRATFDNKDFSFLPGQLVNVTVELDTIPNALVVPRDAISEGPDGTFVYVVTDSKARQLSVKVLFDDAKNVAIEGDVKPGDQVIVEGQLRVDPSGAVNVLGAAGRADPTFDSAKQKPLPGSGG